MSSPTSSNSKSFSEFEKCTICLQLRLCPSCLKLVCVTVSWHFFISWPIRATDWTAMVKWLTGMYCIEPIFRHDWLFDMNRTTKEDKVDIAEKAKIDRPSFLSRALAFFNIDHFWWTPYRQTSGHDSEGFLKNFPGIPLSDRRFSGKFSWICQ